MAQSITENISGKNITDITCSNVAKAEGQVQVTGICRTAQIWEPNDTDHVQNAINWYDTACLTRKAGTDGANVALTSSYNATKCNKVFTTNLVYRQPGLNERDWYCEVEMAKYISLLINTMNHDSTISELLNPVQKIQALVDRIKKD